MGQLKKFLTEHKSEINALSEKKIRRFADTLGTSRELKQGPLLFYDHLIRVLEEKFETQPTNSILSDASAHGKECLRLGYSLSHVVHAYGAICQGITELATLKNCRFSPDEFNVLNRCLDVAISAAVSEYHFQSNQAKEKREVQHLGFLAHELRNALSSAMISHEMIKGGMVGVGGNTSAVLEENLVRMRNLIDRSLSEVRMRSDSDLYIDRFSLTDLLDQVIVTAKIDAAKKNQSLLPEIESRIEIEADRQLIISAVANVIQNAIKYTEWGGKIRVRAKLDGNKAVIEVEDECEGIDPTKISSLFKAFTKENRDRSGLGLGLTIVHRAIHLSQGKVFASNNPHKGCTFTIEIPLKIDPQPPKTVGGKESPQPTFPSRG
jgi:signal transduction histidine kinase